MRLEAFVGGTLRVPVRPRSYAGTAAVVLLQGQRVLARREARVRDGHLVVEVPMPAYGAFRVRLVLPARDGLARADEERRGIALPRDVAYGATGPAVRALVRRLKALRIYVPEPTDAFDAQVQDSVIAFQKAYDLERTGAVDADVWRWPFASRPLEPARRTPATHIEVDLRRQILVKVIGGEVARVIPISSGATGNTPTGVFTVQRKDTATTSLFGGLLYDVLTYHGNFAIHGYPDVPPWPASHGCTRVPSWIAPWLFAQSSAGETVVNL